MAVTPNTGKTSGRYARFLSNGYDLSGDMRSISAVGSRFNEADVTGWSDSVMQYLSDNGEVLLEGFTALMNNTATATGPTAAGANVLMVTTDSFYNSVFLGIRSAPAIGNPSFASVFESGGFTTSGGGGEAMVMQGTFYGSGIIAPTAHVWGHALAVGTELTATGQGGSIDNGASSANGYIAIMHVTQTAAAQASNNWAFVIEHSTNDSTWATLATFTADGSAITAERLEGSGTVNRYVRLKYTRTAGTARPWVTFIRK